MKQVIIQSADVLSDRMEAINKIIADGLQDGPVAVTIKPASRTLQQNAMLHPLVRDIAKQVKWCGERRSEDDWREILVSATKKASGKQSGMVIGIEGEIVMLGNRSSQLSKRDFSDLLEMVQWFGAENGVAWSADSRYAFELHGDKR